MTIDKIKWGSMRGVAEADAKNRIWVPVGMIRDVLKQFSKTTRSIEQKDLALTWGDMGLFTGPHQMSFSEFSSLTIRLSSGERPVFAPEYAVSAPLDVMAEPDS